MPHKDPEAKRQYMAAYHRRNSERKCAVSAAYYRANRERCLAAMKQRQKNLSPEKKAANLDRVLAYSREWKRRNPEKAKERQLLRKYNLTLADYRAKLEAQEHLCAICGKHHDDEKRGLAVDHDHATGQIRDLLCKNCNQALGSFKESVENLLRAIAYIQKWKGQ